MTESQRERPPQQVPDRTPELKPTATRQQPDSNPTATRLSLLCIIQGCLNLRVGANLCQAMTYKVRSEPGSEYLRQLGSVSDYRTDRNKANARLEERSSYVIVIPAPPGSQVAIYETDEDEGRQIVWRTICADILSDRLDNAGQLTNAVTTAGPMVEIGPGSGWVHWGDTTP